MVRKILEGFISLIGVVRRKPGFEGQSVMTRDVRDNLKILVFLYTGNQVGRLDGQIRNALS